MKISEAIRKFRSVCFVTMAVYLSGCGARSVHERSQLADSIAQQAGFQSVTIPTKTFKLVGYHRFRTNSPDIIVYIEGDGFAWLDRYTISRNPTPLNPVALKLATVDESENVLYLGRPCQYVDINYERRCTNKYWTSHRFSQDVLDSYDQALSKISNKINGAKFHLVGFSGGGAIATLLSEKREDIATLRTIAGNLDHAALNYTRKVSQLNGSLNPISIATKLQMMPQIHYSGGNDKVIPSWISKNFSTAVGRSSCVKTITVPGATHIDGWVSYWSINYVKRPSC